MQNVSGSPQSALNNFLEWRKSSETQALLQFLRDKAELARSQANKTPSSYRVVIDGRQELPDYAMVSALRERFLGNYEGLTEVERHLSHFQTELEEQAFNLGQPKTEESRDANAIGEQ